MRETGRAYSASETVNRSRQISHGPIFFTTAPDTMASSTGSFAPDPCFARGYFCYVDNPSYRYSRILVPALAYLLTAGQDRRIDAACLGVNLVFLFLGSYWTAQIAQRWGWSPWTGLLFLAVPAAIVSIDRLTIDLAMVALCIGYIALRPLSVGWFTLLAAGALCRETGFLPIAAACIGRLRAREYRNAAVAALMAAPGVVWIYSSFFISVRSRPTTCRPPLSWGS